MTECSFLNTTYRTTTVRCENPVTTTVQLPGLLPDGTARRFIPSCASCAAVMVEAGATEGPLPA